MRLLRVESSILACTMRRPIFRVTTMSFCFRRFSLLITILGSLAAILPAQRGEGEEAGLPDAIRQKLEERRGGLSKARDKAEEEMERKKMTPDERLAAGMRRGSKAHCQFIAACRPPKLLPGQSGTLLVTAILKGRAVLPAPLQIKMTPKATMSAVSVGAMRPHPARAGTMAKAYVGRPVYENTAEFEIPVTMGNDAVLGSKQTVLLDLQFDIFDGGSAQAVGRFIERVSADIEVAPFADPAIAGRANKPAPPVEVERPEPSPSDSGAKSGTEVEALGGTAAVAGDSAVVEHAGDVGVGEAVDPMDNSLPPTTDGEGGMPFMLMAGGGAILLVIVLLLLRKK